MPFRLLRKRKGAPPLIKVRFWDVFSPLYRGKSCIDLHLGGSLSPGKLSREVALLLHKGSNASFLERPFPLLGISAPSFFMFLSPTE
jgi:hypothetical protein